LRHPQQIPNILAAHSVTSELSILVIDNSGFNTPSGSSGISHELSSTTTIHLTKQRHRFIDGATSGQETVVLEDNRGIVAKFLSDTMTFLVTKNDTMTPILLA
jgi:hypothetical protein